ncbi:MAG: DUF2917 domain-containing protein [Rhodoferax sp.]|nr:DUF2917 domain-containing protein [Rhodoferax sp.]
MSSSNFLEFQTSHGQDTVPGFWKLAPGRALSLQPRQPGWLRVAQGQVWVTLGALHQGAGNELGDFFLHAGEQLAVRPGQHLVLEPFERGQQQAVFFEWTPGLEAVQVPVAQNLGAVTLPLRELGLALGMVGSALGHLGVGLLAYGRQVVSGRPVVQAPHCS